MSILERSDIDEVSLFVTLQMARNVYEALNQQLLDELPKLLVLSDQVLVMCVAIFIELMKTLQSAAVKVCFLHWPVCSVHVLFTAVFWCVVCADNVHQLVSVPAQLQLFG